LVNLQSTEEAVGCQLRERASDLQMMVAALDQANPEPCVHMHIEYTQELPPSDDAPLNECDPGNEKAQFY